MVQVVKMTSNVDTPLKSNEFEGKVFFLHSRDQKFIGDSNGIKIMYIGKIIQIQGLIFSRVRSYEFRNRH